MKWVIKKIKYVLLLHTCAHVCMYFPDQHIRFVICKAALPSRGRRKRGTGRCNHNLTVKLFNILAAQNIILVIWHNFKTKLPGLSVPGNTVKLATLGNTERYYFITFKCIVKVVLCTKSIVFKCLFFI